MVIIDLRYIVRKGEKVLQKLEGDIYPNDEGDGYEIVEKARGAWQDVRVETENSGI